MTPFVSVLMPVYNAKRYVARSIESVLTQTFDAFEFVIIDDGSSDGTTEIVEEFAQLDERILLISRPNTGIVGALNDGLARVTGEYIARIDADDICAPERFEKQVARLEAEPELVAVGCQANVTDGDWRRLGMYHVPLTHEEIEARHLAGRSSIHHPAVMLRSKAVQRVGGYREGFCPAEDFDLWLRLGEVGRLANLPETLITKRLTADGIVGSSLHLQEKIIERILQETWERRNLPGAPAVPHRENINLASLYRQWSWMALKNGEGGTAKRYALKAVIREPLVLESWQAIICSLRGR